MVCIIDQLIMQVVSELDWKIYVKQLRVDTDYSNQTNLYSQN